MPDAFHHLRFRFIAPLLALMLLGARVENSSARSFDVETGADPLEEFLVDLNRTLFEEYMLRHDVRPYEEASTPGFLFVADIGVVETREEILATAANLDVDNVVISNEEYRRHQDTVVLVGSIKVEGRVLGYPIPPRLRYTSVFANLQGEWKLVLQTLTPIIDPTQVEPDERER